MIFKIQLSSNKMTFASICMTLLFSSLAMSGPITSSGKEPIYETQRKEIAGIFQNSRVSRYFAHDTAIKSITRKSRDYKYYYMILTSWCELEVGVDWHWNRQAGVRELHLEVGKCDVLFKKPVTFKGNKPNSPRELQFGPDGVVKVILKDKSCAGSYEFLKGDNPWVGIYLDLPENCSPMNGRVELKNNETKIIDGTNDWEFFRVDL